MSKGKALIVCAMVLALVATLCLGCAEEGEEEEGKVTITIGHISDMTGPASTALVPINHAMDDIARYYNEEELIPGVELRVVHYDARYDPSRDIPGWDWVKGKGAKVAVTALPTTAQTLARLTSTEKMPLWAFTPSDPLLASPEWVFLANLPTSALVKTLLEWISENDPDYPTDRPAKIGSAGWEEPYALDCRNAVRDYAQDHPDKFEWVGGYIAPMGVMTWSGEVAALKDCDYLWPPTTGTGITTFMQEFRNRGYTAKFIGTDSNAAYRGLIVDSVGYEAVDGMLLSLPTRWWNETGEVINLAKQLLNRYHSAEAADIIYAGIGYCGGFHQGYAFYQILEEAINQVGAENFDGQAFYDTAIDFTMTTWEGYETWGFSQTKRYTWDYVGIYEYSAAEEDIVRKVTEWLPAVLE